MAMFVDAMRWETDPEYRATQDAEIQSALQVGADRAVKTFGELKQALDDRGLATQVLHTGGGVYCLAIALDPVDEAHDWRGWRMLIGEPEEAGAGIVMWEASVEDEEGALDAITLTLHQASAEPLDGLADQLASLALRMTGGGTSPLG